MTHRMLEIETNEHSLAGYVLDGIDTEQRFKLQTLDGEVLWVNGWMIEGIRDLGLVNAPAKVYNGV